MGVKPTAVIVGGPITGMVAARSLYRAGVPVVALGSPGDHFERSRCCVKAVSAAGPEMQQRWLEWLLEEAPDGAVILPASDDGLELIARHRGDLTGRGLRPAESDDDAVLALLDKDRTHEIASRAGIRTPQAYTIRGPADMGPQLDSLRYPCGLKAVHRHVFERHSPIKDKLIVARDRAELDRLLHMLLDLGLEMQVTDIIEGPDERIVVHTTYLDESGEPLMQFTHRKLRQRRIHFGVGCYSVGEWMPAVAAQGLRFAQAAGVRGMAVTEFKEDPVDGGLWLFESNPRFDLSNALVRASGFDLALLSYERASGRPSSPLGPARWGRHLWHPNADLRSFMDYRRCGELTASEWVRSLLHPQTLSLFAWDDPWPSIVEQFKSAKRGVRLAKRQLTRFAGNATQRGGSDVPQATGALPEAPSARAARFAPKAPHSDGGEERTREDSTMSARAPVTTGGR